MKLCNSPSHDNFSSGFHQSGDFGNLWSFPGLGVALINSKAQIIQHNAMLGSWIGVDTIHNPIDMHRYIKSLSNTMLDLSKSPQSSDFRNVTFTICRDGLQIELSLEGMLYKTTTKNLEVEYALICWISHQSDIEEPSMSSIALEHLLKRVPIGIISINADWSCEFVNEQFCLLTEKSAEELLGRGWTNVFYEQNERLQKLVNELLTRTSSRSELHLKLTGKKRRTLELDFKAYLTTSGHLSYAVGALVDVSERVERQNEIHQLANFDVVTGLHNRRSIQHQLQRYIDIAIKLEQRIQLFFVDLDGFKAINDLYGHHIGDMLLHKVGQRISSIVRSTDIVARFGGDEFLILIPGNVDDVKIDAIAENILNALTKPVKIEQHQIHITASIGIATFVGDKAKNIMVTKVIMDEMVKQADIALYAAKNDGKNRFSRYSTVNSKTVTQSYSILQAMADAVSNKEFFMNYQPIININTGKLKSVEALIRWDSEKLGRVPPDQFIALAEAHGKILSIQQCMVELVCNDILAMKAQLGKFIEVAINLSGCQVVDSSNLIKFLDIFEANGIDPTGIILEITENMIIEDSEQVQVVFDQLLRKGFRFALDDFGTGYSSLSYLAKMPIKWIKLDKSFIFGIENIQKEESRVEEVSSSTQKALVDGVVKLAHALDKSLIAEGVENKMQLDILHDMGCDFVQGYVNARPMPLDELISWIANREE